MVWSSFRERRLLWRLDYIAGMCGDVAKVKLEARGDRSMVCALTSQRIGRIAMANGSFTPIWDSFNSFSASYN